MKRTFEQGAAAYKAGVKMCEVQQEVLANPAENHDWLMGFLNAQNEAVASLEVRYGALLEKQEVFICKLEQQLEKLVVENMALASRLKMAVVFKAELH
ncbi:hypothetical protein [Marinomonas aquiplantarum]|uniref:Uncharacterized protein n=1 Tax=Marinomonas aquiplantarum TaxID=491951 RepID=A0A366D0E9_9GAMM|nr:hypothetical protein [Marinomonas aquiplantarum]RBO83406.1 hypothetical protein DFP76_104224 [Marinomonas aquiplantarum]